MKSRYSLFLLLPVLLTWPSLLHASPLQSMNAWIEQQLSSGSSGLSGFFFLFLGGVLASLLPCTYPLYPITVNILRGRSQDNRRFLHPMVYFSGIAFMYFVFGVIASFTGGAFNTVLHLPVTNLIIAIVIFLLGLSAADLLYLPLFSGPQGRAKSNSVTSTFFMGMSAGLLSSACVGPVVVSILIGIASASTTLSFFQVSTAASKMLMFGMGVGLPFLLLGVFGISLPKSGKWMKYIQWVMGALIIYFSYVYLEKALLGFGFNETALQLIPLGILVVLLSVYFFQPVDMQTYQKTKKSLLFLSGLIGVMILGKAFLPGTIPGVSQAAGNSVTLATETEQKGNLTWYLDKEAAYAEAAKLGKPVFVDFHADWCANCKEFQKTTQSNPELNAALKNAILLKIYDGTPEFKNYAADTRFPELKVGLPFFVITDKDGNLLYKTNDYLKADEMSMFLSN